MIFYDNHRFFKISLKMKKNPKMSFLSVLSKRKNFMKKQI